MPTEIDHDRLFKELLTTFFWEFFDLFFPDVAAYTDRASLEFLDKEVFTDITEGERYEVDILVRARFRDRETFFLVNVENQSTRETDFGKRLFKYFARLYEKYDLPVYPIAVFSFDQPYRAEPDTSTVVFPDRDVITFRFQTVQLNRLNWRDYVASENPIASALMAKMRVADADRQRVKLECLRLLLTLRLDRARMKLIAGFVDSYLKLSTADERQMVGALRAEMPERMANWRPEERNDAMELMTTWERVGREDGIEIGLVQGLVKGREEKARELVLRLLSRKFGALSPRPQDRIAALSPEQTDTLAGDLLDFKVPADLDAWLSANTIQ